MAQQATVLILADVGDAERAALEGACSAAGFAPSVEPSAEAAIGKLTAKRVLITQGLDKGKKFDRGTGCEIKRREQRSWYRHTLRDWEVA